MGKRVFAETTIGVHLVESNRSLSKINIRMGYAVIILVTALVAIQAGLTVDSIPGLAFVAILAIFPFLYLWIRKPDTLFLVWFITSPLLHEHFNISGGGIPNITLDRIVLIALGLRLVLEWGNDAIEKTSAPVRNRALFLAVGIYVAAELVGSIRGVLPLKASLQYFLDRVLLPVSAFALARQFSMQQGISFSNRLMRTLVWIGCYSIILELLRRYAGIETWLYPNGRTFVWGDVPGSRAVGELYNPMIFGAVVLLCFSVIVYGPGMGWEKRVSWPLGIACLWAIVITFTRSVWLSFAGVLGLMIIVGRERLKRTMLITTSSAMALALIMWSVPTVQTFLEGRLSDTANVVFRQEYALRALEMFAAQPIVGWGNGAFDAMNRTRVWDTYTNTYYFRGDVGHNSFLLMLADRGLITFVPYGILIGYLVLRSIALYRAGDAILQSVVFVIWSELIVYLVTANTIQIEFFPYFISVFWTLLGIADGLGLRELQIGLNQQEVYG